jgi:hypothetical protein
VSSSSSGSILCAGRNKYTRPAAGAAAELHNTPPINKEFNSYIARVRGIPSTAGGKEVVHINRLVCCVRVFSFPTRAPGVFFLGKSILLC